MPIAVSTPIPINLSGNAIQDDALYFFNSADSFYTDAFFIDTDYQIPFRIDGGVSVNVGPALVALDVGFSDWAQATINDIQLKDADLNAVFREVVDVRIGSEVTIPNTPLRVRGGYARTPYALKRLQADRITGDQITVARINTERQLVSLGAGVLVGAVLTIDAAYEHHMGERQIATLLDSRTADRFLISASYRF